MLKNIITKKTVFKIESEIYETLSCKVQTIYRLKKTKSFYYNTFCVSVKKGEILNCVTTKS